MDRLEKSGLLVVPETARDENTPLPTTGVVIATGRMNCAWCGGLWHENQEKGGTFIEHDYVPLVEEGDMIMFSKYAGCDVYFNEEAFRIMETREILCTLEATESSEIVVLPVNDAPPEVGA